jgi:hypothetical protein
LSNTPDGTRVFVAGPNTHGTILSHCTFIYDPRDGRYAIVELDDRTTVCLAAGELDVSPLYSHADDAIWSQGGAHVKVFEQRDGRGRPSAIAALYHDSSPVSVVYRHVRHWPAWLERLLPQSYQRRMDRAVEAMKREALWRLRVEAERGAVGSNGRHKRASRASANHHPK